MYCSTCGKRIQATNAKYCVSCGADLATISAQALRNSKSLISINPLKTIKVYTFVCISIISLLSFYILISPYFVLKSIQNDYMTENYQALSENIDYSALRNSLQNMLSNGLKRIADEQSESIPNSINDTSLFVANIRKRTLKAIDEILIPGAFPDYMRKNKNLISILDLPKSKYETDAFLKNELFINTTHSGYKDLNHFVIRLTTLNKQAVTITLSRKSLINWKLTDIDFSESLPFLFRKLGLIQNENEIFTSALSRNDYQTALKWAKISADHNEAQGLFNLAVLYENGWGLKQRNLSEAIEFYKHAAENGNGIASYILAELYWHSTSMTSNLAEAKKWLEKAKLSNIKFDVYQQKVVDEIELAAKFDNGIEYIPKWIEYIQEYKVTPFKGGIGAIKLGQSISLINDLFGPGYTEIEPTIPNNISTISWTNLRTQAYLYKGQALIIYFTNKGYVVSIELASVNKNILIQDSKLLNSLAPLGQKIEAGFAIWGDPKSFSERKGWTREGCGGITIRNQDGSKYDWFDDTTRIAVTEYSFPGAIVLTCGPEHVIYSIIFVPYQLTAE